MDDAGVLQRLGGLVASMYWTWPTALFFAAIAAMLVAMTLLQLVWPTVERKGFLPMPTTRGDRLFIGLLGSAWIHLGWLAATGLALWGASILAAVWFVLVMRYG
jgi:predicted small integral membrane protein